MWVDPADRSSFPTGEVGQIGHVATGLRGAGRFRAVPQALGAGDDVGYSRVTDAALLPGRLWGPDIGDVVVDGPPRRLVWDRVSALAGGGKPRALATTVFGTLGKAVAVAPAQGPRVQGNDRTQQPVP
jgi:hypothetical protein